MSMGIPAFSPDSTFRQPMTELLPSGQAAGTARLAEALQPGYEMTQNHLGALMREIGRGRLNMSEGEKAALQMHVSQFSALVTLAMNVSLGIGKACEKLQQG